MNYKRYALTTMSELVVPVVIYRLGHPALALFVALAFYAAMSFLWVCTATAYTKELKASR